MPNTPVPAAATGLPNSNIIPFPQPACDDFRPIQVDMSKLAMSDAELGMLRIAAASLGLERDELKRRSRTRALMPKPCSSGP